MKIVLAWGRDREEIEKAILPALIYAKDSKTSERWTGHAIALGWWDFSIKAVLLVQKPPQGIGGGGKAP